MYRKVLDEVQAEEERRAVESMIGDHQTGKQRRKERRRERREHEGVDRGAGAVGMEPHGGGWL